MIKTAIIGLGKMGISHCSIVNAQPDVCLVAVCDASGFVLSAVKKYTKFECYKDYKKMVDECNLDCVIIATPTKFHAEMIAYALNRNLHVYVEKPFCLTLHQGQEMLDLVTKKQVVNQVGYHNRFIGTFQKMKELVENGVIGDVYYFRGEAYGPVVLKPKGGTWRANHSEGGGCLYDYTSHVVNLVDFIIGTPDYVKSTTLPKIYSKGVEDAVYSTLCFNNGLSGHLSVNWSDESYRKMSTQISAYGSKGKIISDALECKIFMREENRKFGLEKGWNMRYITDTTQPVGFYLRGEEYSGQIEYFFSCIRNNKLDNINSFASAFKTDVVLDLLQKDAQQREVS